jgi:alkylhydroperoxidase/carboxymuconolactone decarboxylase family protein
MSGYYHEEDLGKLADIGEDAPALWKQFQEWYTQVLEGGALSRREKSLIALAVAHAIQCPYSIDAFTEDCLEKGVNMAQISEAVHVAAAMRGGSTLMHALQMRNAARRVQP